MKGVLILLLLAGIFGLLIKIRSVSNQHVNSSASILRTEPASPGTNKSFHSSPYKKVSEIRNRILQEEQNNSSHELSKERFQKGLRRFGTDNKSAKRLFLEALDLDHSNRNALKVLAGLLLNEGNKENSRQLATECIALDRADQDCHAILISSYTRYGEFDKAYQVLSDCLLDTPDNIQCVSGMENYYLNRGQINEAKNYLDKLLQIEPDSIWTNVAQASYQEKIGNLPAALNAYNKACQQGQSYACNRENDLRKYR